MPFGLTNAPSTFQRLMNDTMHGLQDFTTVYLDDILVFSPDVPSHLAHLRTMLQRLREAQLKAKRKKCKFLQSQVQYLGHIVAGSGIAPDPEKVSAIAEWNPPTDVKGL